MNPIFSLPEFREPDWNQDFLKNAPNCTLVPVERDGISPFGYHALSVYPEYFKINGKWVLATESRMDTVCVADDRPGHESVDIVEFRNLKKGDKVVVGRSEDGSEGIYVYANGFATEEGNSDVFAFRSGRSRETAFSKDFDTLYDVLKYEQAHQGHVTWIIGSAVVLDPGSRAALIKLIREGYVDTIFCGNGTAALDLEQAAYGSTWGQESFVREQNSNRNLYRTINAARQAGSLEAYVAGLEADSFVKACIENKVELIMAGTIRDRFTLPGVIDNVYEAQNAMRAQIRKTSTVIFVSAVLFTIASGNMTPSYNCFHGDPTVRPVYMYTIDIQEFAVNKLSDRGTLTATSIVTNAQDFMRNIGRALD